ncbi:Transferase activity protein [Halocaridina rubra]|uniref:N-acetylgalactosaminide beta-1,3-galactosyltransferase n=1 Tax=Halocaridina rubra TaxID=373956 RepID=A0AAN8WPN8_HALRR
MRLAWASVKGIMKVKNMPKLALAVIGIVIIVLLYQAITTIYYYRDYIVLFIPESPLPVMRSKAHSIVSNLKHRNQGQSADFADPPRILCLIVTSPKYHDLRASHVDATWSRHCTKAIFLTTERDVRLSNVLLTPGASSYYQLWDKVTQGFEWAYDYRDQFDWFYKADDDTFTIIENLQAALSGLDPERPQATGNMLCTWDTGSTYLNGGAGYVLSRGAVIKLVEEGLRSKACSNNLALGTNEDVNMANCLAYLGVDFLDSRDELGNQRFNIYPPKELVDPRQANRITHLWLKKVSRFPYRFGYSEMSESVISFHYVDGPTMYLLYYLIYIVNPANAEALQSYPFQKSPQHTVEANLK